MSAEGVPHQHRSFDIDFAQRIEPGSPRQAFSRGIDGEGRAVNNYGSHAGAGHGDTVTDTNFEFGDSARVDREPNSAVSRQPLDLDDAADATNDSGEH